MQEMLANVRVALKRFPYTYLCGFVAAVFFSSNAHLANTDEITSLEAILFSAILGIPLSLGIVIATETRPWPPIKKSLLQTAVVLFPCLGMYFYLSSGDSWSIIWNYVLSLVLAHLLLTYAVNLSGKWEGNSYWNFNFLMLKKFVFALLISGGWLIGSVVILVTVEFLFKVRWLKDSWEVLFASSAFVLHPLVFCSSFPSDFSQLERQEHPRPLRLVAQYVLLPVVFIYFTVLFVYFGKSLFGDGLPRGAVASLALSAAGVGLLTLITLLPLEQSKEHPWVKKATALFYLTVLPLLGLSVWSMWVRAHQYGLTEPRYAVYLFSGWLMSMAVAHLLKRNNFMLMHLSFCVVMVVATIGPLSLVTVSRRSQKSQLRDWLRAHKLVDEHGKILVGAERTLPQDEINRFSNIVSYLVSHHPFNALDEFLPHKEIKSLETLRATNRSSYSTTWDAGQQVTGLVKLTAPVVVADPQSESDFWWSNYSDQVYARLGKGFYANFSMRDNRQNALLKGLALKLELKGEELWVRNLRDETRAHFTFKVCYQQLKENESVTVHDPTSGAWLVINQIRCNGRGEKLRLQALTGTLIVP